MAGLCTVGPRSFPLRAEHIPRSRGCKLIRHIEGYIRKTIVLVIFATLGPDGAINQAVPWLGMQVLNCEPHLGLSIAGPHDGDRSTDGCACGHLPSHLEHRLFLRVRPVFHSYLLLKLSPVISLLELGETACKAGSALWISPDFLEQLWFSGLLQGITPALGHACIEFQRTGSFCTTRMDEGRAAARRLREVGASRAAFTLGPPPRGRCRRWSRPCTGTICRFPARRES